MMLTYFFQYIRSQKHFTKEKQEILVISGAINFTRLTFFPQFRPVLATIDVLLSELSSSGTGITPSTNIDCNNDLEEAGRMESRTSMLITNTRRETQKDGTYY